jgi:hypothetical protein
LDADEKLQNPTTEIKQHGGWLVQRLGRCNEKSCDFFVTDFFYLLTTGGLIDVIFLLFHINLHALLV